MTTVKNRLREKEIAENKTNENKLTIIKSIPVTVQQQYQKNSTTMEPNLEIILSSKIGKKKNKIKLGTPV